MSNPRAPRSKAAARAPKKKAAKRPPLSRDAVLEAALALADAEGIDAVSMRSVAQALRVEAMSLYHHVDGKDAILDGLVELVVAEITLPTEGGDWRATMRTRALSAHAVLLRHRWATMLFVARLNIGPNMLRYVDATIRCLRAAGFSWPMADHVWNAIDAYVYGFTLAKLNFPIDPNEYASSASGFLPMIPWETHPGLRGLSEEVIAGRHDGMQHLEPVLEILLDGFERLRTKG